MSDLNRTTIIGRLTRDPELKYTSGGTAYCNFAIANNRTYKVNDEKKEEVSYFDVTAWGKVGEIISQYFKKGQRILLEGRLKQDRWEKDGNKYSRVGIILDNFNFIEKAEQTTTDTAPSEPDNNPFSDEDIPF